MPFASKVLMGFIGLSGIGTTPLFWASPTPPPIVVPYIPPEGYKFCHRLTAGVRNYRIALYVCSKNDGTNKPSSFKRKKITNPAKDTKTEYQWSQITSITRSSATHWEIVLKDGTKESLLLPPFWTRTSWSLKPEEHRLLTKGNSTSGYGELTCNKDSQKVLTQSVYL